MRAVKRERMHPAGAWLRGRAMLGAVTAAMVVGLSVFGAAGSAQAATDIQWHVVYRGHAAGLYSVTATSTTNAWAVGTTGSGSSLHEQFMHWNGKAWSVYNISNIDLFNPVAVEASAADNVWAFGYNDGDIDTNPWALIFNGSTWTPKQLPAGFVPGVEAVLSPTSVWGISNTQTCTWPGQSECTVVVHWNGTDWSTTMLPGQVQAIDAEDGHAYFLSLTDMKFYSDGTGFGKPVIYEPTTKWLTYPGPAGLQIINQGADVAVESNGQRYLEGELTWGDNPVSFYHGTGASTWSTISVPASDCPPGTSGDCPLVINPDLTYDDADGFWAGYSAHYTGTAWVNTDFFGPSFGSTWAASFQAVAAIPGSASVWGVGGIGSGDESPWTNTLVAVNGSLP